MIPQLTAWLKRGWSYFALLLGSAGLLYWFFRRAFPTTPVNPANTLPGGRTEDIGKPDLGGITQAEVFPLVVDGILHPQVRVDGKVVPLPSGIKPSQVEEVVVISPTTSEVVVISTTTPVTPAKVKSLVTKYGGLVVFLLCILVPRNAVAIEVPKEDLQAFVQLAKEEDCRNSNSPKFELSPITIVTDKQGRVFYTGAEPNPYRVKMTWCSTVVEAKGAVSVLVSRRVEPTYGFRLRPKAYLWVLPLAPGFVDAGLAADLLYYKSWNLNLGAGFRSVGAAVGLDLTKNFGVMAGIAFTYSGTVTPSAGAYFAF